MELLQEVVKLQPDDKLAAAIDLAMFVTSPNGQKFWCDHQKIPCFPPGADAETVFKGDQEMVRRMRGFFEPTVFQTPIRYYSDAYSWVGQGAKDTYFRLIVEYLQDKITLEQLQQQLQDGFVEGAKDYAQEQLDKGASGWDWAKQYLSK